MDVCEVHLLIAPRPLLFESAERDECFPIAFTRQGFARVQAGYRVFGAEDMPCGRTSGPRATNGMAKSPTHSSTKHSVAAPRRSRR